MAVIQILPESIHEWLNRRGITDNIISEYHIAWNGKSIAIPIADGDGRFLFYKYRKDPNQVDGPKYTYDTGASMQLFGLNSIRNQTEIFICEGEFDALVLISQGFSAVSSTGGALSWQPGWVRYFDEKNIYVCFDNDEAGRSGAVKIHYSIPDARIIQLPMDVGDGGDITDYFTKMGKGKDDFITLAKNARSFLPFPEDLAKDKKLLQTYKNYANQLLEEKRELKQSKEDHRLLETFLNEYVEILESLNVKKLKKTEPYDGEDRISEAKRIPITEYLKFNKQGFAPCLWHKDKTPSLHYYEKHNRVYCFGCGTNGDVIDVFQEMFKVKLSEALNMLLHESEEKDVKTLSKDDAKDVAGDPNDSSK